MSKQAKIKLAMLVPSFKQVGPVIVAIEIAKQLLTRENYEITMISLRHNTVHDKDLVKKLGLEIAELQIGKFPTPIAIRRARKLLKSYDIVHSHSFWPTVIASGLDQPTVSTIHNNPKIDFANEYGQIFGKIMTKVYLKSLSRHTRTVAISKFVKKRVALDNTSVIYNGISDEYKQLKPISSKTLRVVAVGNINKNKNVMEIVQAIKQCHDSSVSINCDIVGDGPLHNELVEFVSQHKLEGSIKIWGKQSRLKTLEIISAADCLVHAALDEGFGLVVAEAYMCQKPVIVRDIPVMKEIVKVGETGFTYRSLPELINLLSLMTDKVKVSDMGKKARSLYSESFTVDKTANQYTDVYKNALTRGYRI